MRNRAEVELGLRNRPFQRGMDQAKQKVKELRTVAGRGFSFGRVAGISALLVGLDRVTAKYDRMAKLARGFGLESSEGLQRLGFAAEQNGTSLETVAKAMFQANRAGQAAAAGMTSYQRAFDDLGVSVAEFNAVDQEEQFLAIMRAMEQTTDRNKALAAANILLGRSAKDMAALFAVGADEVQRLGEQVAVVSDQQIASMEMARDAMNRAQTQVTAGFAKAIGSVVLLFQAVVQAVTQGVASVTQGTAAMFRTVREGARGNFRAARLEAIGFFRRVREGPKEVGEAFRSVYEDIDEMAKNVGGAELGGQMEQLEILSKRKRLEDEVARLRAERAAAEKKDQEESLRLEELLAKKERERIRLRREAAAEGVERAVGLRGAEGSDEALRSEKLELELDLKAEKLEDEISKLEGELAKAAEEALKDARRAVEEETQRQIAALEDQIGGLEEKAAANREGARRSLGEVDRLTAIGIGAGNATVGADAPARRMEALARMQLGQLEELTDRVTELELSLQEDSFEGA